MVLDSNIYTYPTPPMECSQLLVQPRIWSTMLDAGSLPMTALLRNLGRLSAIGVASVREQDIAKRLSSEVAVKASRLHPISLLEAMRVYESGRGDKGSLKWTPSQPILDALEVAFYSSFKNVGPTGLRYANGELYSSIQITYSYQHVLAIMHASDLRLKGHVLMF